MVELALSPNTGSECEESTEAPDAFNKYCYPEFAGWNGERYLKKLLRQILPMALYRTWEIFADHQALGSDCYLGVTRLAEIAGRTTRTMEKNLASLCAKQLLVERAERKVFRRSDDGTLHSRVVVVKDFRGLYALAHDYHEWTQESSYIAPDRETIALVEQEPHLVAKVRRFENYRRVLYTRPPGPAVQEREEDRWFTEYQPEYDFDAIPREAGTRAIPTKRDAIPAKLSAKELPKDLAEGSLKRINRSTTFNTLERDSVDSVVPSLAVQHEERNAESVLQQNGPVGDERTEEQGGGSLDASLPTPSFPAEAPSVVQDKISFSLQGSVLGQRPACASHDLQPLSGLLLADSFLAAISGPFGDQSPKGTRTRVRAFLRAANLSHPAEVVMCLIRAYLVARDTRAIRPEHCHLETGQVNRMPLFCAMVPRFVEVSRQGPWWESDWRCLEEEIASDACLAQWWNERQVQVNVVGETTLDSHEAPQEGTDAPWPAEADQMPTTPGTRHSSTRRVRLSQTDDAREERAVYAHKVLRQLRRMALPIQEASVLWEHVTCGNPLYHRYKSREVCALCFPDPAWPEEAIALLRSIVEGEREEEGGCETAAWIAQPLSEEGATAGEEAPPLEGEVAGWTDRDEAYANAVRLLDAMTGSSYAVEVFLELIGDGYQVVVRSADGELVCEHPGQVEYLIGQAQNGTL